MKLKYDKDPQDCELNILAENADYAITYLCDKIRYLVAGCVIASLQTNCQPSVPIITLPDHITNHSIYIAGYIEIRHSHKVVYSYSTRICASDPTKNVIKIDRAGGGSRLVALEKEAIAKAIAELDAG